MEAIDAAFKAALAQSSPVDEQLGAPEGTVAVLATAVALLSVLLCSGVCSRGSGKRAAKSQRAIRNTVLLAGPAGSGKTTMMHQVRHDHEGATHTTHKFATPTWARPARPLQARVARADV
jgi:hypothetical protein